MSPDERTLGERIQRDPPIQLGPKLCDACHLAPCRCRPNPFRYDVGPRGGPTPAHVSAGHVDWLYHGNSYEG